MFLFAVFQSRSPSCNFINTTVRALVQLPYRPKLIDFTGKENSNSPFGT